MRIRCAFIFLLMLLLFAVPASADFVFPADLTEIGEEAFANDESITGVLEIPEGVTSIGAGAFQGCGGILSVVIPEGVSFIGENAFGDCAEMTGYITGIETDEYLLDVTVRLMEGDKLIAETTTDQKGFYSLIARPGEYTLSATHADYEEKAVCVAILANESMQQDMDLHIAVSPVTDFTWRIVNSTEVAITGYTGSSAYMRIPEMINGMMVTTIGQGAFENNSIIKVVVMPDSITTIGSGAFQYCSNLMYTNIPVNWTTVTKWEYTTGYIWRGCTKLLNITIPEGLVTVPAYAFWWCANIETVSFPSTLESIGYQAFSGNSNLTHVSFQDGLKVIGERAFEGCTKLQNVEFPNSLTTIGTFAFQGCKSFTHIRLPDSVTNIGRNAFAYCENLESCNIPPNWTTVGQVPGTIYYGRIWEGTKIQKMVVPEGITKLPDYAFANCHNITAIDLPSTLQVIGGSAFYDCTGLNNIDIPDSVHTINGFAFDSCTGLTSIKLPTNLTAVPTRAFINCSNLMYVEFPAGITTIGTYAFEGCTSLYSFEWPDTVTTLRGGMFQNCSNLSKITLPDSLTAIDFNAFYGCTSLSSITIPNNVTFIGNHAFQKCTSLIGIEIPDAVTTFENGVFEDCTNLTSVIYPSSLTYIRYRAFANCTSLSGDLVIPNSVTSIGDYAFQNCTGLNGELSLPNSLTSIGNNAFENCTGFQGDLVIPDSVTTIGSSAFLNSGFDNAVVLSDSVSALSASVFGSMDISMFIGGTALTTINDTAFANCELLTAVFLYNKIENADTAFTSGTQIFYWDENKKSFYLSSKPIVEQETVVSRIDPHIAIDGDSCTYINNSTVELPINVELKPGLKIVNPYTEETLHTTLESPALYISVPYCCTMESELFAACEDEEHALVMLDEEDSSFESGISLMKLSGVKSGEDSVTAHIHCSHSDRPDHDIKHQIALQVIDANGVSSEWKEITVELFKQEAIEITHISGSSRYWPVLETDYEFEIGWQLNADPIENGGYNVYLFEKDAPEKCYKLNSDYVTDTTIRCSSAIFYEILGEIDVLTVYVKVEYVDTAKGEVVCTGVTGGTRYRTLCKKDWLQNKLDVLQLGCQEVVVLHDMLYYGEYHLGDQVYKNGLNQAIYFGSLLYKTLTGKVNELQFDPGTQGLLMAASVMTQVASEKPEEPPLNSDVKKMMELIGFEADLLENPDGETLSKLIKGVSHTEDVIATIMDVYAEYTAYHTVTREDVQPYIDIFRDGDSENLHYAASYLELMTKDETSLFAFLLYMRGCETAGDILVDEGYDGLMKIVSRKWMLFVNGLDAIANVTFNAGDMMTAQIDLMTTVGMAQEIRVKYEEAYINLVNSQIASYDEYMENVYSPFVEIKDRMLDMTALEYTKYVTVDEKLNESKINQVMVLVVSIILGKDTIPQERSVEDYMNEVEGYLEPALKDYYQIFVEPYSW